MGLTQFGYQRRTYDDILNDKIKRAKELFGENIDTSDQGALGKFLRINAYDQAMLEETLEAVYYARFPNTASGTSLDRLLVFGGISRNPATEARYSVRVHGTAGHLIEVGFLVGTDTDLTFYSTHDATIGDDGTCLVEVSCTEAGSIGNINAGAINKAVNPDANITAVGGIECLTAGVDEEGDTELRERFKAAMAGAGSCNENAIRAAILRVPTVQYAAVIANNTNEADADGRPPHSFEAYVLGGNDYEQEIAQAIYQKRPVGIQTVGDKSVTIMDVSGNDFVVNYSPAPNIAVTVRAILKVSAAFTADGAELVRSKVADYINSLGIGNTLVLSSIYGHIYAVAGVTEVTKLELSTDGGNTYSTNNVSVPEYGVAVCANVHVEVGG